MRWEELFADLEGQADAALAAELAAEVAERTRREVGRLRLVDRLRAAPEATPAAVVVARLRGAGVLTGTVADVGADWVLLSEPDGRGALVPLREVLALSGLGDRSELPGAEGEVEQRLDLRYALRRLVRDRAAVEVVLLDGTAVSGTFDRVAADHVDLAQHAPEQARRARAVHQVLILPLSAIALVRVAP